MKITMIDNTNVMLNDVYKVTNDQWQAWQGTEAEKLIDKFSINKAQFQEEKGKFINTSQTVVFSNILRYELLTKSELMNYSYREILELITYLSDKGSFTSKQMYNSYLHVISHYTEWGYENKLREDIVAYEDITQQISVDDAVDLQIVADKTMTTAEMRKIAVGCNDERVELCLLGAIEGLKVTEVLEIKLSEFNIEDNHPLTLEKRTVNVSEYLYDRMYEHSKKDSTTRTYRGGREGVVKYADSGYLIRPVANPRATENKMKKVAMSLLIRKDLNDCGYDMDARDFRTSSIFNDAIDGLTIEQINEKYNLQYQAMTNIVAGYKLKIITEKRRQEGTI